MFLFSINNVKLLFNKIKNMEIFDFLLGLITIILIAGLIAVIFVLLTPLLITGSIGLGITAVIGAIFEYVKNKKLRKN